MNGSSKRSTAAKVALFRRCFTGLPHVYGTYDVRTGRVRQVKQPVTDQVILAHLQGRQSYGVYLLVKDRTKAVVADFDTGDLTGPMDFLAAARGYSIPAYIERSKSKGYHVWIFLDEKGVRAAKARLVVRHILAEIEQPSTEVFPKQDSLDTNVTYGNFIHSPLFGRLVPKGRTVFVDPNDPAKFHPDQWSLLANVDRVFEGHIDDIIELNGLESLSQQRTSPTSEPYDGRRVFGLPTCAQAMLAEGVTANQRVESFRLAVNLRRAGLPFDSALAVLRTWAGKNKPTGGKRVITEAELKAQTAGAYNGHYHSCGCEDPAVAPFCDASCPLRAKRDAGLDRHAQGANSPQKESRHARTGALQG